MWMKMVTCIRKVARKELKVTKGDKCEARRKSDLCVCIYIGVHTT
jgi:hypothetical protein